MPTRTGFVAGGTEAETHVLFRGGCDGCSASCNASSNGRVRGGEVEVTLDAQLSGTVTVELPLNRLLNALGYSLLLPLLLFVAGVGLGSYLALPELLSFFVGFFCLVVGIKFSQPLSKQDVRIIEVNHG